MSRVLGMDNGITSEVWAKESELMNLFGMTLKEAHVYNLVEIEKKPVKEIADAEGTSVSTVKTFLARARRKTEAQAEARKMKMFVIPKLPATDQGRVYKTPTLMKVGYFLAKVYGTEFHDGNLTYLISLPADNPGDVAWYKENVASKTKNLVGGTEGPTKCRQVGEEMAAKVFEKGGIDKIGWGILKYYLDQMYIKCDIYED